MKDCQLGPWTEKGRTPADSSQSGVSETRRRRCSCCHQEAPQQACPARDSGLLVPVADERAAWLLSGWDSAKLGTALGRRGAVNSQPLKMVPSIECDRSLTPQPQ